MVEIMQGAVAQHPELRNSLLNIDDKSIRQFSADGDSLNPRVLQKFRFHFCNTHGQAIIAFFESADGQNFLRFKLVQPMNVNSADLEVVACGTKMVGLLQTEPQRTAEQGSTSEYADPGPELAEIRPR